MRAIIFLIKLIIEFIEKCIVSENIKKKNAEAKHVFFLYMIYIENERLRRFKKLDVQTLFIYKCVKNIKIICGMFNGFSFL